VSKFKYSTVPFTVYA